MTTPDATQPRARGVAVILIGLGLALAPVAFQMFDRAPKGGRMIEQFRPFMTTQKIDQFSDYLDGIGAAESEVSRRVEPGRYRSIDEWHRRWGAIDADMTSMLETMRNDIGRFRGVSALPPFLLFPWFFVLPGLMAVALGAVLLRRGRRESRPWTRAIAALGVGLLAAPAMFQMFSRAPGGAAMIDDFRPLMTSDKVTAVQGYFLTLGAAEGQLRTEALPRDPSLGTPVVRRFVEEWPTVSKEMAPMIGTMADNLGNFAAVDALPPFWLFPWFFVVPGLALIGLGLVPAGRRTRVQLAPAAAVVAIVLLAMPLGACGNGDESPATAPGEGTALVGLFRLTPGSCAGGRATGSYFRMVQPNGTLNGGPYVINGDSPCSDKTWTVLSPGSDGGLRTGTFQTQPAAPFDGGGNAVSGRITAPQKWFAVTFALATNERDPQTGAPTTVPTLRAVGTTLTGDLSAFAASWNGQHFNQGAPKPGGARPGLTAGPKGLYDPATRAFAVEWSSQIVGGPFNNFTGIWHLDGTFEPA